jgi:hypothetical protein
MQFKRSERYCLFIIVLFFDLCLFRDLTAPERRLQFDEFMGDVSHLHEISCWLSREALHDVYNDVAAHSSDPEV